MSSLSERVVEIVGTSLYSDESMIGLPPNIPPPNAIVVEGVINTFAFDPKRLESNRAAVRQLIVEIVQDAFYKDSGGGWSFLNLCCDAAGEHWAEHRIADDFTCLCIGLGLAGFCAPRSMWPFMPGSVPYIWFERPVNTMEASA